MYSTFGACPNHPEIVFESLEPRMFQFQLAVGRLPNLPRTGRNHGNLPDMVIPDKTKSIMDGALAVYGKMELELACTADCMVGKKYGFDLFTPIKDFTEEQFHVSSVR